MGGMGDLFGGMGGGKGGKSGAGGDGLFSAAALNKVKQNPRIAAYF
jgi:hypothetical protein